MIIYDYPLLNLCDLSRLIAVSFAIVSMNYSCKNRGAGTKSVIAPPYPFQKYVKKSKLYHFYGEVFTTFSPKHPLPPVCSGFRRPYAKILKRYESLSRNNAIIIYIKSSEISTQKLEKRIYISTFKRAVISLLNLDFLHKRNGLQVQKNAQV